MLLGVDVHQNPDVLALERRQIRRLEASVVE
jgi:hypothetical protein